MADPFRIYAGDTGSVAVSVVDAAGRAVNLSVQQLTPGAILFFPEVSVDPVELTWYPVPPSPLPSNCIFPVPNSVNAFQACFQNAPAQQPQMQLPAVLRLQVFVTDVAGNQTTLGVLSFNVLLP